MVENFIKRNSGILGKKAVWEALPKKMMYQTYCVVFDYLLELSKIKIDDRKVVWIWDAEKVRNTLNYVRRNVPEYLG
jgi:hypothetical protein